jgi:hypothetical protein
MSNLDKLLKQQESLKLRIAAARKAERNKHQKAAAKIAEETGVFMLPLDVLKHEFSALVAKNKTTTPATVTNEQPEEQPEAHQ